MSKQDKELNDSRSLHRPAWTQDDLNAFNHKHQHNPHTDISIQKNYYQRSRGI